MKNNEINLLFGATSDYLPFALVTAMSVIDNVSKDTMVNIHFLYADIVKPISSEERNNWFEMAQISLHKCNANIKFYDVSDKMYLLDGQNIGMWGKEISLTHYIYLLAPLVLDVDKVIYLDTDMIVNTDLAEVYNIDIKDNLLSLASPSGIEIYKDMSNSGFIVLNLKQWRNENTLKVLLEFGQNIEKCWLCDQNLIYQYFTKNNPNKVMLLESELNVFPHKALELKIEEIKIIHYAALDKKVWDDTSFKLRTSNIWWHYAKKTPFYEYFIYRLIKKEINKEVNKEFKRIDDIIYKITSSKLVYYRYKILSKILWGKKRQKYKQKYKELKRK